MPEPQKTEKYVLLDDDSDCETEEFNKMKMSLMDSRSVKNGRKYTASKAGRCSAWCQPQWICHSLFIFILLASQVFLFLCILRQHWEIEMIKLERTMEASQQIDKKLHGEGNKVDGNANLKYKLEDPYKKFEEIKGSISQGRTSKNGAPTRRPEYNVLEIQALDKRINIIQESIIHFKENLNSLQARCEESNDWVENKPTGNQDLSRLYKLMHKLNGSTVSSLLVMKDEIHELRNLTFDLSYKFRTMEISLNSLTERTNTQTTELDQFEESLERLLNISENLKSHQGQLEQNLDSNYRQISLLREMVYQSEDALNRTDQPVSTMVHLQAERTTDSSQQQDSSKTTSSMSQEDDVKSALRSFFYAADWTGRGYLTYEDLVNNLGIWAPPEQKIKEFDENNDGRFSYMEMINALGLQG
ncbi:EF-hand calcium-binding domain-containing protein 14-like isoform X2 [Pristis pectinata]|uniref:EF-hand calcium-binding domain-containing protein 14-like isoform X2 n=1 Tax=Pristis pectinata TaxID=685728 RepID=UPI00223E1076|nr:EF-hand calcium-binding domain-containing protein 14-like isoform X2 [Pristis pectinata]